MNERNRDSSIYAIGAALLWGLNYPIVKLVLRSLSENDFLLIRFSISVLLLSLLLLVRKENLRIDRSHWVRFLFLGLLGVGVYNVVWTAGIHRTTAANMALMISTAPIFTGLYSAAARLEKLHRNRIIGTLVAFAGISLVVTGKPGAQVSLDSGLMAGNLLGLVGSILFSFYAIVARPLLQVYSPLKVTTIAMAAGLPVLVLYGLGGQPASAQVIGDGSVWLELAFIILCGTVVAYVCWYRGVQQLGPTRTVVFHYLVSVVSMVIGGLALAEPVSGWQIVGAGLVLFGLVLQSKSI